MTSTTAENQGPLLAVRDLKKYFPKRGSIFSPREYQRAVDGVSFEIPRGKTLALVGESGCGKTTVGMMILGLLQPTGGEITYEGRSLAGLKGREWFRLRRQMQVVFQDPYSSLNARMTVQEILGEGMWLHRLVSSRADCEQKAAQLLEKVGLSPRALGRYPHEFSGGQRQRIAIARALSVEPRFIICDEPTSALDVSVQSQVLNVLTRLQREEGLTYLFVTHNLAVVEYMADEVCVMEAGKIVERGNVSDIFDNARNPYTRRLLSSIPSLDPEKRHIVQSGVDAR